MTASARRISVPPASRRPTRYRWLRRHRLILLAVLLSLALHSLMLLYHHQSPQRPSPASIQAQLLSQPLKSRDQLDQRQQQEQTQSRESPDQLTELSPESAQPLTQTPPEPADDDRAQATNKAVVSSDTERQRKINETGKTSVKPLAEASQQQPAQLPQQQQEEKNKARQQQISNPQERSYVQQLSEHLNRKIIAPAGLSGKIQLRLSIRYRQIATSVTVIKSSGNPATDDWVVKAVLAANPFPPAPEHLPEPYLFYPTLDLDSYTAP